jgi:hypothetical protein
MLRPNKCRHCRQSLAQSRCVTASLADGSCIDVHQQSESYNSNVCLKSVLLLLHACPESIHVSMILPACLPAKLLWGWETLHSAIHGGHR